jgi:transcriptional regulator with XRE-family HTH domain
VSTRAELARFLRTRREALRPDDVGMPRARRRRTPGLRREEVAALAGISSDYYSKIEQPEGPVPSDQVLGALARALQLTLDERDHLFRLGGLTVPPRTAGDRHVNAGLGRVLARLADTAANVVTPLGETLVQTPLARALFGDETGFEGPSRSRIYRWFTDPAERARTPEIDHARHSESIVGHLVSASAHPSLARPVAALVRSLSERSDEFTVLWSRKPVPGLYCEAKTVLHPDVGEVRVYGQTLVDPDQQQTLTVFTAEPGSESDDKLALLAVIGTQSVTTR